MKALASKQQDYGVKGVRPSNIISLSKQAAIRAGYSPKTAHSQGQRLLKNVEIQKAIQVAMDERGKARGC